MTCWKNPCLLSRQSPAVFWHLGEPLKSSVMITICLGCISDCNSNSNLFQGFAVWCTHETSAADHSVTTQLDIKSRHRSDLEMSWIVCPNLDTRKCYFSFIYTLLHFIFLVILQLYVLFLSFISELFHGPLSTLVAPWPPIFKLLDLIMTHPFTYIE